MSENSENSENSKDREERPLPLFTYRLKPGGFTHYRDGGTEKMEPGELIDMTEVRFKGANLRDRFELVGAAEPVAIRTDTQSPVPPAYKPGFGDTEPVREEPEPVVPESREPESREPEPEEAPVESADVDWSSVLGASWASVVKTIKGLDDVDYVRSLREAEKAGRARGSVLNAANARVRQLRQLSRR